jgi:hypothetical protein
MHVTIGTVDDSVKHFQKNTVCELALSGSQREENQSNIVSLIWNCQSILIFINDFNKFKF